MGWRIFVAEMKETSATARSIWVCSGRSAELQFAGVFFDLDDAGVLLEFPGQLIDVDVDGEDLRGAGLQEAVGEAAGGGADVQASSVRRDRSRNL